MCQGKYCEKLYLHYFAIPVNRQETANDFDWRPATTINPTPIYGSTNSTLPSSGDNSDILGRGGKIAELISTIHSSLDGKLSNVMTQLSGIENRMVSLETRQMTLEQEVRHYTTSSSSPNGSDSSSSSSSSSSTNRRRITPVELQVTKLRMYASRNTTLCVFYHALE